jgi:hypothetical protein
VFVDELGFVISALVMPSTAVGLGASVETLPGEGGGGSVNIQKAAAWLVLVP